MTSNTKTIADATLSILANEEERPTIERVRSVMSKLRHVISVSDDEFSSAEHTVQARLILSMEKGVAVAPKFESWLRHRKAEIDNYHWERYRQLLLQEGWGPAVIRQIDATADELLDYAGDPTLKPPLKRRGLVVGNVQSGKTATYIALCNKAADAGYRLIIILAGSLNSLRYQTQQRLDEGFVGFDSAEITTSKIPAAAVIGVGHFGNDRAPHAFTSKAGDFDANTLKIRTRLDGLNTPVLMVVKKNKSILKNLYAWLLTQNPSHDGKIDVPLLLIDDEADAASVNTGSNEDPRAINAGIRKLLDAFSRSSYVGFTATPFANVFIAPDSTTEMLGDDLFPRDYIYSLEPPSDYIGPVTMFEDDQSRFLCIFDDAETIFPPRHKKDLVVDKLPQSLINAMDSFLVVNAVRDLREHRKAHRSMLVNVSWANNVQNQVADLLRDELQATVREVQAYGAYSPDDALQRSDRLRRVNEAWAAHHSDVEFAWADIQSALFDAIKAIEVRTVNMSARTSRLDYDANMSRGLRVIAVGGNALSRGLTLEGLSTSYIYRNSQAYDTLLQMGRWFGYRPDFRDLCRVWMTEEAASWYTHITQATEELKAELRRMHDLGLTPRQFGLRVRAHPDTLIVTARVKMKTATADVQGPVTLSLHRFDGFLLSESPTDQQDNLESATRFLSTLMESGEADDHEICQRSTDSSNLWKRVPKKLIAELLSGFHFHATSAHFQPQQIAHFLRETDIPELGFWDVAIPSGEGRHNFTLLPGVECDPVERKLVINKDGALEVSRRRLGTAGDERLGLTQAEYDRADAIIAERQAKKQKPILANYRYRCQRTTPLLLLWFIQPTDAGTDIPAVRPIVSLSISAPSYEDEDPARLVKYQTNKVWQQMKLSLEGETDEDDLQEDTEIAS